MSVPITIQREISQKLQVEITKTRSISGGSINQAALFETGEQTIFVKWNRNSAAEDMFAKEWMGLELLRSATDELWIPKPLLRDSIEGTAYLVLTAFSNSARSGKNLDFPFGAALARLHQHHTDQFGLEHDNYIGRLPQSNKQHKQWPTFFVEERIRPLLRQAIDQGKIPASITKSADRFYLEVRNIFPSVRPALLHGDLWGGNYTHLSEQTAIYDPAVYYGHPEMELAFTFLFGGFDDEFYKGYESVSSIESGFVNRRSFYNLYHLLTHTVMFGGHYAQQAVSILNQF